MSKIWDMLKKEKVEWKRLGEVCEFKRGQVITKKAIIEGNIPVVAGGQKPAYYHGISNREGETIAVAGSGAYAGFVSYWTTPIFLSDAFSIEPLKLLNKKFLYYWLLNNQNKIYELKQGSGIPHVYSKDLSKIKIPIPSLKTQEKIVDILDRFTECSTNLCSELNKELELRIQQYEYYRNMLLSEEYLKKLSEKSDLLGENDFIFTTLGDIVDIVVGGDIPKNNFSYEPTDKYQIPIYSNGIGDKALYGYTDKYRVKEESVTISARGTIGYVSYKNSPYYPIVRLLCLIPKKDIKAKYLYYLLQNMNIRHKETGIPSLTADMVKNIKISLPTIEVQNKVVEILDKFHTIVHDLKIGLPREIELRQKQYEYYSKKLFAFNGNDEI